MLTWHDNRDAICNTIAQRHAQLKIVLKTKDEDELIEPWIAWHAKICGIENIIIFDNGSTSDKVLDTYARHGGALTVYSYHGFVDAIHNLDAFASLYGALDASCSHFVFLDTDEFLTLIVDGRHCEDAQILAFLRAYPEVAVFPGTWLHNCAGSWRRFVVGEDGGHLVGGMRWGKPVRRANVRLFDRVALHNDGIRRLGGPACVKNNFFVLHMTNLEPQRRIRANLNKLVAHGALAPGATVAEALTKDRESFQNPNVRRYFSEIAELSARPATADKADSPLKRGIVELSADGRVIHYSKAQEARFNAFLEDAEFLERCLGAA